MCARYNTVELVDAVCNACKQVFDFLRALGLLRYQKRHLTVHFCVGHPEKGCCLRSEHILRLIADLGEMLRHVYRLMVD